MGVDVRFDYACASILGAQVPKSCLKSESCWTQRTLTKHSPASTDRTLRPLVWSTETGWKARYVKSTPKLHRGRSRRALGVPKRASGALQRAREEALWVPKALQRRRVAPWLCPSVLEPTLWMVSLRNVRSDPKLHSACQRVPREGRARPREPKRSPRGA